MYSTCRHRGHAAARIRTGPPVATGGCLSGPDRHGAVSMMIQAPESPPFHAYPLDPSGFTGPHFKFFRGAKVVLIAPISGPAALALGQHQTSLTRSGLLA